MPHPETGEYGPAIAAAFHAIGLTSTDLRRLTERDPRVLDTATSLILEGLKWAKNPPRPSVRPPRLELVP